MFLCFSPEHPYAISSLKQKEKTERESALKFLDKLNAIHLVQLVRYATQQKVKSLVRNLNVSLFTGYIEGKHLPEGKPICPGSSLLMLMGMMATRKILLPLH